MSKILNYAVVAILALVLVGGTVYVLARPATTENAVRAEVYDGNRGAGQNVTSGNGYGNSNEDERFEGRNTNDFDERNGTGRNSQSFYDDVELQDMETIEGVVTESGSELLVETADGDILVGLGQAFFRDEEGFTVDVGDKVIVTGFEEDGEFKASMVENLSQETSIVLRDASGRPMWSGRGNRQNRP